MEMLMEGYFTTVQELDNSLMNAVKQFEETLEESDKFRENRVRNMAKATTILLKEPKKYLANILTPLTVQTWWEIFVQQRYPNDKCLEYFRCSRKTFIYLIKVLRPHIEPKMGVTPQLRALNMLKGVSVEKQVAIVLHKLSRCTDYALVSGMFGIHKSTVHKIFYKVIRAINKYLLHKVIRMPKETEVNDIAEQFEERCKIPQIVGAIGSTHIPICPPINMVLRFTNVKNYPSFILQAVVDLNYCFRDISVRHPGSVDDHLVLEDSNIYKLADRVIPMAIRNVNGIDVPYKIVGPSSYPLLSWLLSSYREPTTEAESLLNEHLNEINDYTQVIFDRLKARFSILSQTIDVSFKVAPQIIAACCAFHNICERNEDPFLDVWLTESKALSEKFPQPSRTDDQSTPNQMNIMERDAVRDYLETQILLDNAAFGYTDSQNIELLSEKIDQSVNEG